MAAPQATSRDLEWAGAALYTRRNLRLYDLIVAFNCRFAWRCPRSRLVRHYDEHVSARHLDVGVATGWHLDACRFPAPNPAITLMDLNPDALDAASRRIARHRPRVHVGSALAPFGLPPGSFNSVGLSILLHCLPGAIATTKPVVFEHAKEVLAPGGVIFGSTILDGGVRQTLLSRYALTTLNRRRYASTSEDTLDDLRAVLSRAFGEYELEVQGTVALFSGRA